MVTFLRHAVVQIDFCSMSVAAGFWTSFAANEKIDQMTVGYALSGISLLLLESIFFLSRSARIGTDDIGRVVFWAFIAAILGAMLCAFLGHQGISQICFVSAVLCVPGFLLIGIIDKLSRTNLIWWPESLEVNYE